MLITNTTLNSKRFRFSEDFLAPYYKEGDPFQSLLARSTYLNKYCRDKETWTDTIRRVVEANLAMANSINEQEAKILFHLFWTGQALPPGRGLWTGGVEGIPSDARYNCFSGETRFWANGCLTSFEEAVGQIVSVLCQDGEWRPAEVKCFGKQALRTFRMVAPGCSNFAFVVEATTNHRWITNNRGEVTDLRVGDRILIHPSKGQVDQKEYLEGFAHGFIFGDGSRETLKHGVFICCDKNKYQIDFESVSSFIRPPNLPSYGGGPVLFFKSHRDLKALPLDESLAYQKGFLEGWLAAYGSLRSNDSGGNRLSSQDPSAIQWVESRAPLLGYCVTGLTIAPNMEANFGPSSPSLTQMTLVQDSVEYTVRSITDEGREDDVYCVVEPITHTFTLDGGLVTGNCWFTTLYGIDDWCWTANQLMLGGGVGVGLGEIDTLPVVQREPQARFSVLCSEIHPNVNDVNPNAKSYLNGQTPIFKVPDSREGWVAALRTVLTSAWGAKDLIIDVSEVRARGMPIKTFGGTACGPGPLTSLLRNSWLIIRGAAGRRLNSVEALDITNYIGLCIKAGNVRRCLPGDTLVHTKDGLKEIKDIKVGDLVLTSGTNSPRYMPVTEFVESGNQSLVEVKSQIGSFRCTANHRVAVFDSCNSYIFKDAGSLREEDRLVFVSESSPGSGDDSKGLIPIAIKEVNTIEGSVATYDIEVSGAEEFVIGEGFLVHNSALIAIGDAYDQAFRDAKKEMSKVISHRHTSNNTIAFRSWEQLDNFDWDSLVRDMSETGSGEPGILNLPLIWKTDPGAKGVNPCFSGDTRIAVADGRNAVTIRQLAEEAKDVPVYSMNPETGKVEIKMGRNPRITGYDQSLVRVWLDDDSYLDVTPNHKFILRDGQKKVASDLVSGDSLPRFSKTLESAVKGGKKYYLIYGGTRDSHKDRVFEHRLIARFNYPERWDYLYEQCKQNGWAATGGLVVHHIDYDQLNNRSNNLQLMTFQDHAKLHGSMDTQGESNGRWSGFTSEQLKSAALELTSSLGRRFSRDEWHSFAEEYGFPVRFSSYRVSELGSILELSKLCASELGFEHSEEDPRLVKTYQQMLSQGYDSRILNGEVLVKKTCERCSKVFETTHDQRENSFCSNTCGTAYVNSDPQVKARRIAGTDKVYSEKMSNVKVEQARVCSALKFKMGHNPNRHEWTLACKAEGIPSRIGPTLKFGFKHFSEVLEAGDSFNHKVVRVEKLSGTHTVYNITVDTHHTVGTITNPANLAQKGPLCGVFVANCGEVPLADREACNLAEVFPSKFESATDPDLVFKIITRYCLRQRLTPLLDEKADAIQKKNMRVGVGLGGLCDFNWTEDQLSSWYRVCREEATSYARELGVSNPIAVTTVKPSGCRPWYALTSTSKGILTLEEIFEDHPEGEQWADLKRDLRALQGDNTESKITKTYANGVARVLRLRLSCGLEVESTENHQWWVAGHHNHKMLDVSEWVRADQIKLGDVLEVTPGIYTSTVHTKLIKLSSLALKMRRDAVDILQPDVMSPDLAWLLGYLWGDGSMSIGKYRLRFIDQHLDNLEKAQRILFEQFGLEVEIKPASEGRDASVLDVGSKMLWHWLIRNGVFKYYAEELDLIPSVVRSSAQEDIISFIGGLIDSDGGAYGYTGKTKFMTCTKDDAFARHLQAVCWAVGLSVGRSLNDEGINFQDTKHMWFLTSNHFVDANAFGMLHQHSVKCNKIPLESWYFNNQKGNRRVKGKVEAIEDLGDMPTYDIEVEGTHWYYAGSVKSHNTISLLNGSSPGIHAPYAEYYLRRTRIAKNDPMALAMAEAGVPFEDDVYDSSGHTWVFAFPTKSLNDHVTVQNETIRDQFERQKVVQSSWADNAVSATLSFNEGERGELASCFKEFVPFLKSTSALPKAHGYAQAPYEACSKEEYERLYAMINHKHPLVRGGDFEIEGCSSGLCPIR
jgi:ribonucleotide reductase alpha subunit